MSSIDRQDIVDKSSINFDDAIIVGKQNKRKYFTILVLVVIAMAFLILTAVIPVALTLDYSSVLSASENRIGKKIFRFYLGIFLCVLLPFCAPFFRNGNAYFFKDKVVVKPFISNKLKVYYYKNMKVTQNGMRSFKMEKSMVGSDYNIFKKIKNRYFDGVVFGITKETIENYEIVDDVLILLKNNVEEYIVK